MIREERRSGIERRTNPDGREESKFEQRQGQRRQVPLDENRPLDCGLVRSSYQQAYQKLGDAREELNRVLANLLRNKVEFTPQVGYLNMVLADIRNAMKLIEDANHQFGHGAYDVCWLDEPIIPDAESEIGSPFQEIDNFIRSMIESGRMTAVYVKAPPKEPRPENYDN